MPVETSSKRAERQRLSQEFMKSGQSMQFASQISDAVAAALAPKLRSGAWYGTINTFGCKTPYLKA